MRIMWGAQELRPSNHSSTDPTTCFECYGSNLIDDYYRGETVCQKCGLVINEVLTDGSPE